MVEVRKGMLSTNSARPVHTMGQSGDAATEPHQKEALAKEAKAGDEKRDAVVHQKAATKRSSPSRGSAEKPPPMPGQ